MSWRVLITLVFFVFSPSITFAAAPAPATQAVDPEIGARVNDLARFVIKYAQPASKPVGVLPFTNVGDETQKLRIGELLSSLVTQNLVRSRRVRVAETQNVDRILQEIRLGTLGVIDTKSAVKVGSFVGAQLMLSGTVIPAGEVYQLAVRINDVATAETVGAMTVEVPRRKLIALTRDIYDIRQGWYEAPIRSVLIPGWGQFYNNRPVRGSLYLGLTAGLLGGAAAMRVSADRARDRYDEATSENAASRYDTYEQRVTWSNRLFIAGASLWVLNVVDAAVFGPVEDLEVAVTPGEVRLALRF